MNTIPSVTTAQLPLRYEAAKAALQECSKIDECQDWADKAQALASYARQANDDTMRKLADRIQARAIRRAGELYKQHVEGRETGGRPKKGRDIPTFSELRQQAGMSKDQQITAVRVANVPEEQFEAQVESDDPPTVTKLAEQGTKKRNIVDLGDIPPESYAKATELQGALRRLSQYCSENDAREIACAFQDHEIKQIHGWLDSINEWMDVFAVTLGGTSHDESQ